MCDVSDELVADLGHTCDASGMGVVIDVTALPLSPPASRIIAEDPDLVPRLAGVGDDYKLVFTSPTDASAAIECLSPELALPITATGAGRLIYAGRAGTGIDYAELERLWRRLQPLAISKMPLDIPPPRDSRFGSPLTLSRVHWVRPELVAEVKFLSWTEDNLLRQVVYVGLREDKPARDVRRSRPSRSSHDRAQ